MLSTRKTFFKSIYVDNRESLRFITATKFRTFMLGFFLLIVIMFRVNAIGPVSEDSEMTEEEVTGSGYEIWTPIAFLFACIALIYISRSSDIMQESSTSKNFAISTPLRLLFYLVAYILGALLVTLIGVGWFLFETAILGLIFLRGVLYINENVNSKIKNHPSITLGVFITLISIITYTIYYFRAKLANLTKSNSEYLETGIAGLFLIIISTILIHIKLRKEQSNNNLKLLEMLPWIFLVAWIVMFLQISKGMLISSDVTWIQGTSEPINFISAFIVFATSLLNIIRNVSNRLDLRIQTETPNSLYEKISRDPYNLVLLLYILFISKQFYTQLLGKEVIIAFLHSSIIFGFIAVIFLHRQLKIEFPQMQDSAS